MAAFARMTAEEAAALARHGDLVGTSGFTGAATPKAFGRALADRARAEHAAGREFRVRLLTGASTGPGLDDALAAADAISWRAPFQSSAPLRDMINAERVEFVDMHLSQAPGALRRGFLGRLALAVVEASEATPDGRVRLTTSSGISAALLECAERVVLEINAAAPAAVCALHDVCGVERALGALREPLGRVGEAWARVDPARVVGVVRTDAPDPIAAFDPPSDASRRIGRHVAAFLAEERAAGRLPGGPLTLQAGVGNLSNAALAEVAASGALPPFVMYTEVVQDSQVDAMDSGRLLGASTTGVMLSPGAMARLARMPGLRDRLVIRPQEISNHPALAERFGVVALNTALEVDLYGHVNSTHVLGSRVMNGIGGSGDFVRNALLAVVMAPSTAKGGAISTIIPMATHVDHSEHSVDAVATEHGLADLRGVGPAERARRIIDRCADPAYRGPLREYLAGCEPGHLRHDLARCFEWHRRFRETGRMLP